MKPSKKIAVVLAGALAAAGVAVIAAPNAQAFGPSSQTIPGSLFLGNAPGNATATTNNLFTDTITLTASPAGTANAGNTVTVTLSGANGPSTGPVGLAANGQVIRGAVGLTGAQTATVQLNDGNAAPCTYPATPIGTNSPQGPWTTSGTYTASGNGAVQIRLNQIFFDDQGNKDGSIASQCAGSANNADYYVSPVTQTVGSALPGLAKTAPVNSPTIFEPYTHVGPNASQVGNATFQSVQGFVRPGAGGPPSFTPVTVALSGTVWANNVASGGFVAQWCNTAGASCDVLSQAIVNNLVTDGSGNLSGTVQAPTGITTGNRALLLTQGANSSLTPFTILAGATVSLSPAAGGPGTAVTVSGANFNPTQTATITGRTVGTPPFGAQTADAAVTLPASGTGVVSTIFTVNATNTAGIAVTQGTPGAPDASNPGNGAPFTISLDRCVAYNSNLTGGPGCDTRQSVTVSVLQGRLVQRAYVNTTPATGAGVIDGSAITTPVQGTSNVNSAATQVNLGTLTSPFAPTNITGTLNDITVSDNRGGTFGWSLTAALIDGDGAGPGGDGFNAATGQTISKAQLSTLGAACVPAANAVAWDYNAVGKTAIAGFDDTLNAPGVTAGANAPFSSPVNLCTKSTAVNATTQTTGGVYNITSSLVLGVPAFQAAAQYTAVMQITLA